MKFFTILPCIALGVPWAVRAGDLTAENAGSGVPSYLCERIDRDLLLSDRVDDPLWQKAQVVQLARAWDGQPARFRTTLLNLSPKPGEEWRANFYRIDVPDPKSPEYYAWSPTVVNDFHVPWRFGVVKFK